MPSQTPTGSARAVTAEHKINSLSFAERHAAPSCIHAGVDANVRELTQDSALGAQEAANLVDTREAQDTNLTLPLEDFGSCWDEKAGITKTIKDMLVRERRVNPLDGDQVRVPQGGRRVHSGTGVMERARGCSCISMTAA